MEYIKVNLNDIEFCEMLIDHINNKKPFSMSRFGDGEILLLKRKLYPRLKDKFCERWGINKNDYTKAENLTINIINESLKNSDVLRFMDPNNNICKSIDCNPKKWSLPIQKLEKINRVKENLICDHQVSRGKELGTIEGLKKILRGNDLHIISSRTEILKKKNIDSLLGCSVYYTHIPFNSTWKQREMMKEKINDIKENIVIESLGVFYKDIPSLLSAKGKICLDFGATIDAWCNIDSRQWFNSTQKYLKIR